MPSASLAHHRTDPAHYFGRHSGIVCAVIGVRVILSLLPDGSGVRISLVVANGDSMWRLFALPFAALWTV
jgi:hypothetical protein